MYEVLKKILKWKWTFNEVLNQSFNKTLSWISSNSWKIYENLAWFDRIVNKIKKDNGNLTDINIKLKDFLKTEIKNHTYDKNIEFFKWIIKTWWWIWGFTRFDWINEQLNNIKLNKNITFESISSISKVISFSNPRKYFIYDSRVVYVLNWLILKSNVDNKIFFKMPAWRNKKITFIDISTLINIKDNKSNYHAKDFYYIYCDLIIELHKKIFNDSDTFKTEMLLFSIADNYIYDDIISSLDLKIN